MQHGNKGMIKSYFLVDSFEEKSDLSFKVLLFAYVFIVQIFTKEVTDHGKHFWVHMKQAVKVMHTVVENTDQWVENCIWDSIEEYKRPFFLKDWLNAMFYHICVLVMLNFVKYNINEFSLGENQIISLDFYEIKKKRPNVLDQMCPKTPQSWVKIDENLCFTTVKIELFE